MPTSDSNQRLAVLVKNAPSTTLHLNVGNNQRGIVFFACEQAPLMTFQSFGLPSRCPVCSIQNPLNGEANDSPRGLV
jgi:hypothetical protein